MMIYSVANYSLSSLKSKLYFSSYVVLFLASLMAGTTLLLNRFKKMGDLFLTNVIYLFSSFILLWSLLVSLLDMMNGGYPIVFLTIVATLGAVIVVNPFFYTIVTTIYVSVLLILNSTFADSVFEGFGDHFNFIVFIIMAILITYRHYRVSIKEKDYKIYLENLSYTDSLTGLGNETAFFEEVDSIDKKLKENIKIEFAVVVMDVNNVKVNNDKYGHSFGCHLIVEAARILPTIFTTSKLYHIGGDEYVAIILGDDYNNLDERIKKYDSILECGETERKGIKMALSVARGYKKYENEKTFNEVFQIADEIMYDNKNYIKSKYNFKAR